MNLSLVEDGSAALAEGRFRDAVQLLRSALQENGEAPELWNDLGIALFESGEHRPALECFEKAVALNPGFAPAHNNLSRFFAGCGDLERGLAACRRALELDPQCAEAHENEGTILMALYRHQEALACFSRACDLAPSLISAWINRADACRQLVRLSDAASCYRRALEVAPGHPQAVAGYAALLRQQGETERAISFLREAAALAPHDPRIHSDLLMSLNYSHRFSQQELADESRLWGVLHAAEPAEATLPPPGRRLRIAYLSGDLYRHPVSTFLKQVLKHHDRTSFEVTCYHNGTRSDQVTDELRRSSDRWFVIAGLGDDEAFEMIRGHGIDILIDLSGHTPGNRLPLLSRRPAPIQATWLGYWHSTGVPAIDYLISDPVTVPEGEEAYYSERVLRLPQGRFCYAPPAPSPFVDELPAEGNGCVTFGSFNNLAKLTPEVVALWARVLLALPGSRLVLKWTSFARASVRKSFRARFARHGVTPDRLDLRGPSNHFLTLAEYNDIDIALDPFPFNGGLTSCEALWMGVPVLTLLGDAPIGRQTASFLMALELPELVARDCDDFVTRALRLAGDLPRLAGLRQGLRERLVASPLCDGPRFARALEEAFREMLREKSAGAATEAARMVPTVDESAPAVDSRVPGLPQLRREPVPRQRLRLAYLLPEGEPSQDAVAVLAAASLHGPEDLDLFLYLDAAPRQAFPELPALRRRVAELNDQQLSRLLQREGIDVLVDLAGAPSRGPLVSLSVPVRLQLAELAPVSTGAEIAEPLRRALALEALFRERWLAWFVAQPKGRRRGFSDQADGAVAEARSLRQGGRLAEAERLVAQAVAAAPGCAAPLVELGTVLVYQWRLAEGLACFRRALRLEPGHVKAGSSLLFALNYSDRAAKGEILAASRAWGRRHGFAAGRTRRDFASSPDPERPLRIGYLSPDLYRHSVSYFFEPLLEHHGKEFETFCYSCAEHRDEVTARLEGLATGWRDCRGLQDREIADLVRRDGVDILVDLAGHTGTTIRLGVLARNPAPVQVTWLGYPNTTGLSAVDYRLTDAVADPAGEERWHSERLVRLPHGFLCYRPPADAPQPAPAPFVDKGYVTFGSFNILAKISTATVAAWAAILRQVPGARLLLKSFPLADAATRERVLRLFGRFGIEPGRLTLLAAVPVPEHLPLYREIDIALDPFPYNGTTTSCEALWMGVPVLTLAGERHAGRVGVSLLQRLALVELVAGDAGEYVRKAVALAGDAGRLSAYRRALRPLMAASPLCDGAAFAREVESAYRTMWRSWCRKDKTMRMEGSR